MKAWHFVGETLRDGGPVPPDGEWLEHTGPVKMCESGLHFSTRVIDALRYAPGNTLCRVEVELICKQDETKGVCRKRKILWRRDATEILQKFARLCALDVIHLWEAPSIVLEYLETGDETKRTDAAYAAADAANAAYAAAYAANAAAYAAAYDANAAAYANDAANAAAYAAAYDAADAAAYDAQNARLLRMVLTGN